LKSNSTTSKKAIPIKKEENDKNDLTKYIDDHEDKKSRNGGTKVKKFINDDTACVFEREDFPSQIRDFSCLNFELPCKFNKYKELRMN
jgi:hypothetical protein